MTLKGAKRLDWFSIQLIVPDTGGPFTGPGGHKSLSIIILVPTEPNLFSFPGCISFP